MNNKFKNALKSAYCIPEPQRKDVFLQSLEENKKAVPFWVNLMKYAAVPVTAAIAIIISTSFMDVSEQREQYVEEAPAAVSTTADIHSIHADDVQEECENTQAAEQTANTTVTSVHNSDMALTVSSVSETTAVSSSAYSSSDAAAAVTVSSAVTTITATAAETTSVTVRTSTTTSALRTTMRATTTPMQTDPSPSTYTTMPTMTTANYEPTCTMPTTTPDHEVDEPVGRDLTVYPETSFRLQDNIIDVSDYIDFSFSPEPEPDDSAQDLTEWQYLAKNSDEAVYGTVVNSYYTAIEGLPYKQLDIIVEYPLSYNRLYYNDMISVYVPSEYMSLEYFIEEYGCADLFDDMTADEIEETTVYFPWTDVVSCYNEMNRLFFLSEDSGSAPGGAYRLTAGSVCSIFHKNSGNYICDADGGISFTTDEYNDFMG